MLKAGYSNIPIFALATITSMDDGKIEFSE
jgi:hypothetical protein